MCLVFESKDPKIDKPDPLRARHLGENLSSQAEGSFLSAVWRNRKWSQEARVVTKLGLSDPEANIICSVVCVCVDRERNETKRHRTTDRDTFQCWSGL